MKFNELSYYIGEEVGGIVSIFPLHFFATFNKNEILNRMKCLVNRDQEVCIKERMKTCKTFNDMKSLDYDKCVLKIYQLNDFDLRTHCDDHYNRLSQVWTEEEMATLEFL